MKGCGVNMMPIISPENQELFKYFIKWLLDFYEKSITMKTMGNVIGVDAALSAIGKKLEKTENERLENLYVELEQKIELLNKDKLDYNFINSEEFARIVLYVFKKARADYREGKLHYYANVLVNYSTTEFSNNFYKEWILDKIAQYTVEHIVFMKKIYNVFMKNLPKYESERQIINIDISKKMFQEKQFLSDGLNEQKIRICFADLIRDQFIEARDQIGINIGITEEGLNLIKLLQDNC